MQHISSKLTLAVIIILGLACVPVAVLFPALGPVCVIALLIVACGLLCVVGREIKRELGRNRTALIQTQRHHLKNMAAEVYALHCHLLDNPRCRIPVSTWSMSFSHVHAIVNLVRERKPSCVVELGSGISTIAIARELSRLGEGRLISIDHDRHWAQLTQRNLPPETAPFVDIHVCELVKVTDEQEWYNLEAVAFDRKIDLLIVDGPPAGEPSKRFARCYAKDALSDYLAIDACIAIDDTEREGERLLADHWLRALPSYGLTEISTTCGMAILMPRGTTSVVEEVKGV